MEEYLIAYWKKSKTRIIPILINHLYPKNKILICYDIDDDKFGYTELNSILSNVFNKALYYGGLPDDLNILGFNNDYLLKDVSYQIYQIDRKPMTSDTGETRVYYSSEFSQVMEKLSDILKQRFEKEIVNLYTYLKLSYD